MTVQHQRLWIITSRQADRQEGIIDQHCADADKDTGVHGPQAVRHPLGSQPAYLRGLAAQRSQAAVQALSKAQSDQWATHCQSVCLSLCQPAFKRLHFRVVKQGMNSN